jgi:hypothetical protein
MKKIKPHDLKKAIEKNGEMYSREVMSAVTGRDAQGNYLMQEDDFNRIRQRWSKQENAGDKQGALSRVSHATKSIAKTSFGFDVLEKDKIEERLDVCRSCEHAKWNKGDIDTCGPMFSRARQRGEKTCGCKLKLKAKDKQETCPVNKWPDPE